MRVCIHLLVISVAPVLQVSMATDKAAHQDQKTVSKDTIGPGHDMYVTDQCKANSVSIKSFYNSLSWLLHILATWAWFSDIQNILQG